MKKQIDIELELAEDEYGLDLTRQALVLQAQIVQEALASQKVEIQRIQGTIAPTIQRILDEMLKPLLPQTQGQTGLAPVAPSGPGGNLNVAEPIMKMLGIGQPTNVNVELLNDLSNQFNQMTAFMWKQKLRQMRGEVGLPEHLPIEGMHLNP